MFIESAIYWHIYSGIRKSICDEVRDIIYDLYIDVLYSAEVRDINLMIQAKIREIIINEEL